MQAKTLQRIFGTSGWDIHLIVLQHISNIFPYVILFENKPCDVCHYAK